eukprot:733926-Prymnesium_polylepis.1
MSKVGPAPLAAIPSGKQCCSIASTGAGTVASVSKPTPAETPSGRRCVLALAPAASLWPTAHRRVGTSFAAAAYHDCRLLTHC